MNSGYRVLSKIARLVDFEKDVFGLTARAYGSVSTFFHLLEAP